MRIATQVSFRIIGILLLSVLTGNYVHGQYSKDLEVYNSSNDLDSKSAAFIKLWNPLMRNNLDSLKILSFEILFDGVENKNGFAIAAGKKGLGSYLIRTGDTQKGISYLKQSLTYFRNNEDPVLVTELLNEIGNGYYNSARFREAEKYYLKSIEAGEKSPDPTDAFLAEINLGHVYVSMTNFEKAATVLQHYKNEALKNGKLESVSNAYALLGTIEQQRNNIPLAMEYFQKSADFGQKSKSRSQIAHAYNNLAIVYFQQGETKKTLEYFEKALEMRRKTGNARYICESYFNIGGLYFELKDYKNAERYYRLSLDHAKDNNLKKDEMDALFAFAELYKTQKDFPKALQLMEEHAASQEEYFSELSANNTVSAEMLQSIDEIEQQNKLDENILELDRIKQSQKNVWMVVYGIGGLSFFVLLTLIIFRRRIN